jgi:hypothetical protein
MILCIDLFNKNKKKKNETFHSVSRNMVKQIKEWIVCCKGKGKFISRLSHGLF